MEGDSSDNLSLSSCFICYICGGFFKRPRILPCGHTFCAECLAKLRDDIVNDGKSSDTDQSTRSNADLTLSNYSNGTLSPENLVNNGATVLCESNGTSRDVVAIVAKDGRGERKSSSSCVDDVDGTVSRQSFPTTSTTSNTSSNGKWTGSMSMSSSSTYTCLADKDKGLHRQKSNRNASPRNKNDAKNSNEMSPSMMIPVVNAVSKSKQCSNCGNVVITQRNSSTSPIKRSTSMMISSREQSPTCLRDLPRWDSSSPHRRSTSHLQAPACSFEQKHGREMEPFVCPIPQCNYSMRVMNLARWSPKNKALANALCAWQRQHTPKQDCGTQTNISNSQSVLVTIPRNIVVDPSASSMMAFPRRKRHSSMIDIAIDQAVNLDGPLAQSGYLPRGHYTWKSYAAMVGMNILQQILHL